MTIQRMRSEHYTKHFECKCIEIVSVFFRQLDSCKFKVHVFMARRNGVAGNGMIQVSIEPDTFPLSNDNLQQALTSIYQLSDISPAIHTQKKSETITRWRC